MFYSIEPCKSSIYPFQELKRPLQFLGLYDTTLCNVTHIPAYKVRATSATRHFFFDCNKKNFVVCSNIPSSQNALSVFVA